MQNTQKYVKIATATLIVAVLGAAVQIVQAQELLNTATNKIEFVQDIGKRDLLEEIMIKLDARATETQSTFILVEQPDRNVTLFTIAYPYEDYADTDIPMVELQTYENVMAALEELVQ